MIFIFCSLFFNKKGIYCISNKSLFGIISVHYYFLPAPPFSHCASSTLFRMKDFDTYLSFLQDGKNSNYFLNHTFQPPMKLIKKVFKLFLICRFQKRHPVHFRICRWISQFNRTICSDRFNCSVLQIASISRIEPFYRKCFS